ncbi:MAG TPA: phosphoribosyltransferase family protein [Candidatus Thermoplasmatota archaeon]
MSAIGPPSRETARSAKERLKKELLTATVIDLGQYPYVTHPVLDGFPAIEPGFVSGLADAMAEAAFPKREAPGVDGIITVEAMGIPVAFLVADALHVPLHIARKKEYKVPGEIVVRRKTGYSESHIAFNGLQEGRTYWFVDSLLSTGATLRATMLALNLAGAKIGGAVFLVSKIEEKETAPITESVHGPVVALLTLKVVNAAEQTGGEARGYRLRVSDGFQVRA